jgi:hypothetical protein
MSGSPGRILRYASGTDQRIHITTPPDACKKSNATHVLTIVVDVGHCQGVVSDIHEGLDLGEQEGGRPTAIVPEYLLAVT